MESTDTRKFANPAPVPSRSFAETPAAVHLLLDGTQALLVHQLLGELLDGIREVQFETKIGMNEPVLRSIFDEFDAWVEARDYDADGVIAIRDSAGSPIGPFERAYSQAEIRALRNMTEVVMLELGQEEFFTRTGFSLAESKQLLDLLNAALLEPLHLKEDSQPVSH